VSVRSPGRSHANPDTSRYLYYGWQTALDRPLEIDLAAGLSLSKWVDPRDGSSLPPVFAAGSVTSIAQPADDWSTVVGSVLTAVPEAKDACKGGGWMTFDNPVVKNQGDCVSYVATGGQH
jgi:hypothetical protein